MNDDYFSRWSELTSDDNEDKFFVVQLTVKTSVTVSGDTYWYYDWIEQVADQYTGRYVPAINGRTGDYSINALLPAVGLNGEEFDVPTYAMIRFSSLVLGNQYYEIISTQAKTELFPATLVSREFVSSKYDYGWNYPDASTGGTIAATVTIEQVQTTDGLNPDIFIIHVNDATGGTYTLTEDGGSPTTDIAYDATNTTIQGLLTNFTVTGSTPTYTCTATDLTTHTLTADDTDILPPVAHSPAFFTNNDVGMDFNNVNVWLRLNSGGPPQISITVTQEADSDTLPMIWSFTRGSIVDGTIDFTIDGGSPVTTQWNDDAATLQTELSTALAVTVTGPVDDVFTITCTADNDPHTITLDTTNTFGTQKYGVVWSNGRQCTAAIAGVDPNLIEGYTGPMTPTWTISPDSPSIGPWTVTILNACSGQYQLVVDSGDPINTDWDACPTIEGFTVVSNPDGTCTLTGEGESHSIQIYGAQLRGCAPCPQFLVIGCDGCVNLVSPIECPPTTTTTPPPTTTTTPAP